MLRRCIARSSICPQLSQYRQKNALSVVRRVKNERRYATKTTPERNPKSRKWHLFAVVGLVGFTVGSWYRILGYSKKQDSFQPFELISKEPVSSSASIFTIKTKGQNISTSAWKAGIWNVEFKQPQLQIVRAYTPLPPHPEDIDHGNESVACLRFLIRRDARGGEMSSYLHKLPAGAEIELRGPNVEYIIPKDAKNVVFVAGGTGIAPAMQVAHAMFDGLSEEQRAEKKLHIMWANRKREDCAGAVGEGIDSAAPEKPTSSMWSRLLPGRPLPTTHPHDTTAEVQPNPVVRILAAMKELYGDSLSVSYFVDEEKSYIHSGNLAAVIGTNRSEHDATSTKVIVSGPPGFITYVAGSKIWQDGAEQQGPLGGRLAQITEKGSLPGMEVWKV